MDELKIEEVLELAHGTFSMRDDLANRFLVLQEQLITRQESKPLTTGTEKAIEILLRYNDVLGGDDDYLDDQEYAERKEIQQCLLMIKSEHYAAIPSQPDIDKAVGEALKRNDQSERIEELEHDLTSLMSTWSYESKCDAKTIEKLTADLAIKDEIINRLQISLDYLT